ncbi:MAG: gliding motility-associated C-terminal domain-containing protein [Saprospiraceae bacterium]|nr:gliding motility-associated C-terminal domain-containing protein [Saprospiraceae bacterium]
MVLVHKIPGILDDFPKNGFVGALLEATKPIAVTCGGWLGAPVVYAANDIGVDQILPLERVGKEYIFCKGDGPTSLEHPIIVAHYDGTQVWVNGADTALVTLDAGEFFSIPASFYVASGNIFVRTTEPAFAYQMTGGYATGKTSLNTVSLMFIPPLSCGIPHRIDNIYLPNRIGPQRFDGSLQVVALRNTPVNVQFDGEPIDLGPPIDVSGNEDFVTYKVKSAFSHVEAINSMQITSTGAVYASVIGRREYASYASLLTGYDYVSPEVQLTLQGDGICPDTLTAHGFFDKIKWVYDDTLMQEGIDTTFIVLAPGEYKAVAYLGGCRNTALVADSLEVPLTAPQFDFSFVEPSCYDFPDGQISFGLPNGGTPPYLYSIDHGQHTSADPVIENVTGGDYKLIVQDASGCYNQPVHFTLDQPDSVYVHLVAMKLPKPLRPGDEVILQGFTTNPITATTWEPPDSTGCPDCLLYWIHPQESMWVTLTVFDEGGCPGTDSLLLSVEPPVYAPNVIYPASTVGNDRFVLYTELPSPVHKLVIFDRWGGQVFERSNFFTNSPEGGWDGIHQAAKVGSAVYTFLAEVEVAPGRVVEVTGSILVVR